MNQKLSPPEAPYLFVSSINGKATGQAGFIVPILIEPITVSAQTTGDDDSIAVSSVEVYQYQTELVLVSSPPGKVHQLDGDNDSGKLVPESKWVLVRKVAGGGSVSAYAGEAVYINFVFEPYKTEGHFIQDSYEAFLNVHAPPLTFAPYKLTGTVGSVTSTALATLPIYPTYGGDVEVQAEIVFGASTSATYELIDVNPDPGGLIAITQGQLQVQLLKSQSLQFSIPISVDADVVLQDYTFTFQEVAYAGHQSQNFEVSVSIAKTGVGV